ncbi:manganese-binding transcriptional regulator MntR [Saltatorellus ferox]|uniref:manganese-binding transcriptional regulator MntR n=1 Tax=Saltatorellus ferox TaxID=2528018 RepID=UPI003AF3D18F
MSDRHAAVRRANRTETAEDYVEAIADLLERRGEARVRDLAECFGISHVTVSRTVDRLQRDGLVRTAPYRSIDLTAAGEAMAAASKARHAIVLRFLMAVGVPQPTADLDAEGIEHHVGPDSLAAFQRYVDQAKAPPAPTGSRSDERFQHVRAAHAIELVEDYVEAIGDLIADRGAARVVDLAHHFGVSHVTVSRMLGRLQRDGFVETAPYRPVHLTSQGQGLADRARERHRIVLAFLQWLGVSPRMAELDAEGVEHHVSPVTLQIFAELCGCRPPQDPSPPQT